MGDVRSQPPQALLLAAIFSADPNAIQLASDHLNRRFGPILATSQPFEFNQTQYYSSTMGTPLTKRLFAFDRIIPQDAMPEIKQWTNQLEREIQARCPSQFPRVVNIDPGMMDDGKVMLASTKNNAHRIYVGQGIFVEPTLFLRAGKWEPWPWTYADYRQPALHAFFDEARKAFRDRTPPPPPH